MQREAFEKNKVQKNFIKKEEITSNAHNLMFSHEKENIPINLNYLL